MSEFLDISKSMNYADNMILDFLHFTGGVISSEMVQNVTEVFENQTINKVEKSILSEIRELSETVISFAVK